jgi:hypothetical protein
MTKFRDKTDKHNFRSKKELITSATRKDPLFFKNRVKTRIVTGKQKTECFIMG